MTCPFEDSVKNFEIFGDDNFGRSEGFERGKAFEGGGILRNFAPRSDGIFLTPVGYLGLFGTLLRGRMSGFWGVFGVERGAVLVVAGSGGGGGQGEVAVATGKVGGGGVAGIGAEDGFDFAEGVVDESATVVSSLFEMDEAGEDGVDVF